jgi:hypothetical protein
MLIAIPITGRGRTIYKPQSLYEDVSGFDTEIYASADDVKCIEEVLSGHEGLPFMLMG